MNFLTLLISILFSFFATAIMSYISMATVIGPWIDTTLVLMGMLIFSLFRKWYNDRTLRQALGLSTAAGGIGGILATGAGFSFPTLFFVDNSQFCTLLNDPFSWIGTIGLLAFAAGSVGLVVAHFCEYPFLIKQELAFPIGELVYKMISAADSMKKAWMLGVGLLSSTVLLIMQYFIAFLKKPVVLLHKQSWSIITLPQLSLQMDMLPMFWAIGFVTGHVIAIPLALGMLARFFCIEPLHKLYGLLCQYLSSVGLFSCDQGAFFNSTLSLHDFTIAFCSGMVVFGAGMSFLDLPRMIRSAYTNMQSKKESLFSEFLLPSSYSFFWVIVVAVLFSNSRVLSYFGFSWAAQLYLLIFTVVCTYQMLLIAGKIGLAPLGRFATFVLVPGMFLFGYTPLQITVVSMYVEVAGGVACNALFGRKMAHLSGIDRVSIERAQWLGLFVSSLCVGIVMWLLIKRFGIGLEPGALSVAKAASRALLVNVKSFDIATLLLGVLFGSILKKARVNAVLLLGGILMSPDLSLMLILGGLSTYLTTDREYFYPFWSGVFAANSLWMLLKAFL